MGNGLLDNLVLGRESIEREREDGKITRSNFDTLSKSFTIEQPIVKSIQNVIEIKQKILFAQGKDEEAYDGINLFDRFKMDPRKKFHECKKQYQNITTEECYSWSRKPDNKEKCGNCEWYDKVGKIFE